MAVTGTNEVTAGVFSFVHLFFEQTWKTFWSSLELLILDLYLMSYSLFESHIILVHFKTCVAMLLVINAVSNEGPLQLVGKIGARTSHDPIVVAR